MNKAKNFCAGTRRLTFSAMCVCISLMLAYIEALLPPMLPAAPGIKPGLANIMAVFVLYKYSARACAAVNGARIALSALLFGGVWGLCYGAAGALFSLAAMAVLKKTSAFSPVGVSIAGGVFHNIGQIFFAALALGTRGLWLYLPVLAIAGTLSGACVGLAAALLLQYLKNAV